MAQGYCFVKIQSDCTLFKIIFGFKKPTANFSAA